MKLNIFYFGFVLLFASKIAAQSQNLAKDFNFFLDKGIEYSRWLDSTGLGKAISYERVRMRPLPNGRDIDSTELELFLLLHTNDPDSAVGIWEGLKRGFDTAEDSLENFLYRSFVEKMEIPGVQGSIQIYIRDNKGQYNPCFYIFIWQEPDKKLGLQIKSKYKLRGCKAKTFEITVSPPPVKPAGKSKSSKVNKARVKSANQVFDAIRDYVVQNMIKQDRYTGAECNDRKPSFEPDSARTSNAYRFTVKDLCKEVMKNQYRSAWEKFWGYNSIAIERLSFTFEYYPTPTGFILKCIIDGKYGNNIFRPRTDGYMDMDIDFNDLFEAYKNTFRNDIEKKIK